MSTYNTLSIRGISYGGITSDFGPELYCPECGQDFFDDRPGVAVPPETTFKFNAQVAFLCPYCSTKVQLYVAATKLDTGEEGLQLSVYPIDPDWLEKEIAEQGG